MADSKSPFSFQQFASTYWRPSPAVSPSNTAVSRRQTLTAQDLSTRRQIFRSNRDDLQDQEPEQQQPKAVEAWPPETALDGLRRAARESWREKLSAQQAVQIRESGQVIQKQSELISALFDVLDGKRPREEVERLRQAGEAKKEVGSEQPVDEAREITAVTKQDAGVQKQVLADKAVQAELCDDQQPQLQPTQMQIPVPVPVQMQPQLQMPLTVSQFDATAQNTQPAVQFVQPVQSVQLTQPVAADTSLPLDSASICQPALAMTAPVPVPQLPSVQNSLNDFTLKPAAENGDLQAESQETAHRHRRRSEGRHSATGHSPHRHRHGRGHQDDQDGQNQLDCEESSQFYQPQPDQLISQPQADQPPQMPLNQLPSQQNISQKPSQQSDQQLLQSTTQQPQKQQQQQQLQAKKLAPQQLASPEALLQKYLPELLQKRAFRAKILPQIQAAAAPVCFAARGQRIVSRPKDFEVSKDQITLLKAFPDAVCCVFAVNQQLRAVALRQPCAAVVICAATVLKIDLKDNYALQAADVSGCAAVKRMRCQAGEIVGAGVVGELIGSQE